MYGEEADRNLLEEAVRWVIITIIFVFDPLAVLLLIASSTHWRYIDAGGKPNTASTSRVHQKLQSTKWWLKLKKIVEKQKS